MLLKNDLSVQILSCERFHKEYHMNKEKALTLAEIFKKMPILESNTMRLSQDSVDSQIDSLLLRYQNDASVEGDIGEGILPEHFRLILEEPEEDEGPSPEGQEDMSIGDDQMRSDRPADPREQKIDIDVFAQMVANLAENWQNLLDVKAVILNRAKNLLAQGYSPDLVQEFMDLLDREFGMSPNYADEEDEVPSAPPGGSAGPLS